MQAKRLSLLPRASLTMFAAALLFSSAWAATHQVLHSFNPGGSEGTQPNAGLISDSAGNLYGTANYGGTFNAGTAFELIPNGSGGWTEKTLYNFNNNGRDGASPVGSLVFDTAGNLYGTTEDGGIHGLGTVFELLPQQVGGWTETVLHSFGRGTDGANPLAGLTIDAAGNLYGTTTLGGIHQNGTVFEMSPKLGGGWTETVLHSFNLNDGVVPFGGLIFDGHGNLYSTTAGGGIYGVGTIFEMSPRQGGGWTETVLHSFGRGDDGQSPMAGLVADGNGNLYSTTFSGGIHGGGTVFEMSPRQGGGWTETVLHSFGNGNDASQPNYSALVADSMGNLYGAALYGGIHGLGAVFELSPRQGGGWTETVLHSFNINGVDGTLPYGNLIQDGAGALYGTTARDGGHGGGMVYSLARRGDGSWKESVAYSFDFQGTDGANPAFAALVFDSGGNLYGTTYNGGQYDSGTAFELAPNGSGGWTEKVLYDFGKDGAGAHPQPGMIFDSAGNLYGTTVTGGSSDRGTVFELSPGGNGGWTARLLHSFNKNGSDGYYPCGNLIFDPAGNLYGTTFNGGIHYGGTVFQLSPNGSGDWTENVLYSFDFNGSDGIDSFAGLVLDHAGNLYGTTEEGGAYGVGTVFELSPDGSGGWSEKVVHSFDYNGSDGGQPEAGLILDAAGNLYGATVYGGSYGNGAVFELSPHANGDWSEKVLYSFGNGIDGAQPYAGLVFDAGGNLYGATAAGGVNGTGTVFKLTPTQGGSWDETVLHNFDAANGSDGDYPEGSLILDHAGNLYGTSNLGGGHYNSGTVFQLTP